VLRRASALFFFSFAVAAASSYAQSQSSARPDAGQREYQANCSNCHGKDGKGAGPFVEWLRKSPPDLTRLAASNGGVFPIDRVFESIEGSGVTAHGGRDMPIWGQVYRIEAAEYWGEMPYNAEAAVRARVLSLIDYLYRIQAR
jgi:mono/diheme cytochrome c family protein